MKLVAIGKSCGFDVDTKKIKAGIEIMHKLTNILFSLSINIFLIWRFKTIKITNKRDKNCKIWEKCNPPKTKLYKSKASPEPTSWLCNQYL